MEEDIHEITTGAIEVPEELRETPDFEEAEPISPEPVELEKSEESPPAPEAPGEKPYTSLPSQAPPSQLLPGEREKAWERLILVMLVFLSFFLSLFSLTLSGIMAYKLLKLREQAMGIVNESIELVDGLKNKGFTFTYHFSQTIHFAGDIPIHQKIDFPFKGTIPINTVVKVPVELGFQTIVISVPIDTEVYVDTVVPVDINKTIHVETDVPVQMDIPITVNLKDTPAGELLRKLRLWLEELRSLIR